MGKGSLSWKILECETEQQHLMGAANLERDFSSSFGMEPSLNLACSSPCGGVGSKLGLDLEVLPTL